MALLLPIRDPGLRAAKWRAQPHREAELGWALGRLPGPVLVRRPGCLPEGNRCPRGQLEVLLAHRAALRGSFCGSGGQAHQCHSSPPLLSITGCPPPSLSHHNREGSWHRSQAATHVQMTL